MKLKSGRSKTLLRAHVQILEIYQLLLEIHEILRSVRTKSLEAEFLTFGDIDNQRKRYIFVS